MSLYPGGVTAVGTLRSESLFEIQVSVKATTSRSLIWYKMSVVLLGTDLELIRHREACVSSRNVSH